VHTSKLLILLVVKKDHYERFGQHWIKETRKVLLCAKVAGSRAGYQVYIKQTKYAILLYHVFQWVKTQAKSSNPAIII